jgi:hypothetical protein
MNPAAKLPLFATVKESYALAWNYWPDYLKISYLWLIVALPIVFAYDWLTWPITKTLLCTEPSADGNHGLPKSYYLDSASGLFLSLGSSFLQLFVVASIAVAWHRLILLSEEIPPKPYFRVDRIVMSYFLLGLLLDYTFALAWLPLLFLAGKKLLFFVFLILGILASVAAVYIGTRLSLLFPAKALGLGNITARDVWHKTQSNFWRLLGGGLLCYFPAFIFDFIFEGDCKGQAEYLIPQSVNLLFNLLITTPICISFLSLTYRYFMESPESK